MKNPGPGRPRRWWGLHPATRCLVAGADENVVARLSELHAEHGSNLLKAKNPRAGAKLKAVPLLGNEELLVASKLEHEIDHLQGGLFIDKMGPLARMGSKRPLEDLIADFAEDVKKGTIPAGTEPKL